MATIRERPGKRGMRYLVEVRVTPFPPASKGGFKTRDAAEKWAATTEKALNDERDRGNTGNGINPAVLTFRQLKDIYVKDPEFVRLATVEERTNQLNWWAAWSEYRDKDRLKAPERVKEFLGAANITAGRDRLLARGLTPKTVNHYLAAARRCINWARETQKIPTEWLWPPALSLTEPQGRKVYLDDAQLGRVLQEAERESPVMLAAVVYAVGVGPRQGEELKTRWRDINERAGTTAIDPSKTDTARRTHMLPAVAEALQRLYINGERPAEDEFIFRHPVAMPWKQWADSHGITVSGMKGKADRKGLERPTHLRVMTKHELFKRWEKIRKRADVSHVTWHDLRHSCASFLIQGGANLAEIMHQLGHKRIQTTMRYAHLVEGHAPRGSDALNNKLVRRAAG